jgi:GTPase SAR1 family protein
MRLEYQHHSARLFAQFLSCFFCRTRLDEAKAELDKIVSAEQLSLVPIVVLGNKIDIQVTFHFVV